MSTEQERFAKMASEPFQPQNLPTELRIANALEYIAAQMGDINRKMDALIDASGKSNSTLTALQISAVEIARVVSQLKP